MQKSEFLGELDALLELPKGTLTGKEELESLASWDSLAVLAFIALLDSKCNLVTSASKLADCKTVDDLVGLAGPCVAA